MKKIVTILVFLSIGLILFAQSATIKSKKCINLVNSGLALIKKVGLENAYKEFSDTKGKYVDGELYLFVLDKDGVCLAHGGNKGLIGKNHIELRDVDGVFFIKELIDIGMKKGKGWFDYKWTNPETKKVQKKTTYVAKIPGQDGLFLFCGFYK